MTDAKYNWNDEETWIQLASGRLDAATLQEVVTACNQRPELWQRCALALLEEQVLQQELQALKGSPLGGLLEHATDKNAGVLSPRNSSSAKSEGATSHPAAGLALRQPFCSSKRANLSGWLNNLALVASVMVAFMVGWQASQRWGQTSELGATSQPRAQELVAGNTTPVTSAPEPTESMTGNPPAALLASEQIENVNTQNLANVMQATLDPELEHQTNQLRQKGYDVRTKSGAVPVILRDGTPAIVPFEQINVRPPRFKNAY